MNCEKLVRMKVGDLKALLRQTDRGAKGVAKMTKPELIGRLTTGGAGRSGPSRPTLKRPVYDKRKERKDKAPRPTAAGAASRPTLKRPVYDRRKERKDNSSRGMPGTPMGSPMPGTPDERLRRPTLIKPDRSVRNARGIDTPPPTAPRPKKRAVPRPRLIKPNMSVRSGLPNTPPPTPPRPKPKRVVPRPTLIKPNRSVRSGPPNTPAPTPPRPKPLTEEQKRAKREKQVYREINAIKFRSALDIYIDEKLEDIKSKTNYSNKKIKDLLKKEWDLIKDKSEWIKKAAYERKI